MNAQEATFNSRLYGMMIQDLVKSFEAGDIPESDYDACYEYLLHKGLLWQDYAKIVSGIEILSSIEYLEQTKDHAKSSRKYRHWTVDNDLTPVIPTYWHGRARASNPGFPTYHSRLGRVSIPE